MSLVAQGVARGRFLAGTTSAPSSVRSAENQQTAWTKTLGGRLCGARYGAAIRHDKRRFFTEARATPPAISGLMTSSSTLTL